MCSEPEMRAPASGLLRAELGRAAARRPGISCSARWISLRPNGARERSATRKSRRAGGAISRWSRRRTVYGAVAEARFGTPLAQDPAERLLDELQRRRSVPGRRRRASARCKRHDVAEEHEVEAAARAARRPRRAPPRCRPTTSSTPVELTSSNRRASWGCSRSWRSSTSVNTWRVTSPCWPQPADLVVAQLGDTVAERRRLGVLVDLALPAHAATAAEGAAAVDDRDRAPDARGRAPSAALPAAASWSRRRCELLDGGLHPAAAPRGTARRARARAAAGPRARRGRRAASGCPAARASTRRPHSAARPRELAAVGRPRRRARRARPPRSPPRRSPRCRPRTRARRPACAHRRSPGSS